MRRCHRSHSRAQVPTGIGQPKRVSSPTARRSSACCLCATSAHEKSAGIRTTLSGLEDYAHDAECGFKLSEAREIDEVGTAGIIQRIKDTVGDRPVYFSLDIDVLDPSAAPATGTPETVRDRNLRRI